MLYNRDRLLALMDKFDLSGVVAATQENVYYLSGHASWSQNGYRYGGSQVYVVFPRDPAQSPALLIPSGDAAYAGLDDVWLKEVYIYGRPRKPVVLDPNRLRKEEQRTLEITESQPNGRKGSGAIDQRQGVGPGPARHGPFRHSVDDLSEDRLVFAERRTAARVDVFPLRAHDQDGG